jgi:hypothetical protein
MEHLKNKKRIGPTSDLDSGIGWGFANRYRQIPIHAGLLDDRAT